MLKNYEILQFLATILWSATTLKLVTTNPEINLFTDELIVILIWIICSLYFAAICLSRSLKDRINFFKFFD